MDLPKLGVWFFTDGMNAPEAAGFVQELEAMGYGALWIPEAIGRHPFAHAAWLLANTEKLVIATGIASIYNRDPGATLAGAKTLAEQSGGRFVLGLGVSHQPMVEMVRGHQYGKPVSTMRTYLENMEKAQAMYRAVPPAEDAPVVLAALGPRMLELSATAASGAHPYFTTPEHTKTARQIMGPDAWLCVEQKVIGTADAAVAREHARTTARTYAGLPNYRNNWMRLGFTEEDINNLSDEFIDATFAWGEPEAIQARIDAHFSAGASHVCIQPVNSLGNLTQPDMDLLAKLAPSG